MAVVKEYTTKEGTVVKFNDEAYRDKTPEEMQAAYDNINKVASLIINRRLAID